VTTIILQIYFLSISTVQYIPITLSIILARTVLYPSPPVRFRWPLHNKSFASMVKRNNTVAPDNLS